MKDILWRPKSPEKTKMAKLTQLINERYDQDIDGYEDLHLWSVRNIPDFWEEVWKYCEIIHSHPYSSIVNDTKAMPGAEWFKDTKLNYAENLLRFRDDHIAIKFKSEGKPVREISYYDLFKEVEKLSHSLRELGVCKGDRVVGFMPNIPEAVTAMLATSSIGAIWSSSSPDFGIKGVLDRFVQIEPKVIFAAQGYQYNGKYFDSIKKLNSILEKLPTVEKVIIIDDERSIKSNSIKDSVEYDLLLDCESDPLQFEQLPFEHPLYIMYSSGTTGLPKSIVHSAGGTLLQHMKELQFHCDLTRNETIFYFTTCGWMMWNWLISSLSIGSTIVLFDGSPFYPSGKKMWQLADELEMSIFGTSAKYIDACKEEGIRPSEFADLSKLRMILSTGSPLLEESFDYVYDHVKKDVHLASISGGTDIISCFALGSPTLAIKKGELQCRGLGMDVHSYDPEGKPVLDEKGELVCISAFPSMPIYFWNDKNGDKYQHAYFLKYPGIWHHGDFIRISSDGGLKIFGRSDATLNPGGIRIGTSEIYNVVESMENVEDSLVIGQDWDGDQRVILFVMLKDDMSLDEDTINDIKYQIKTQCSPRHVPNKIIKTKGIPYTINGKKVEVAVKKIIDGEEVTNSDALSNPHVLDHYRNILELKG
jgi:acetoacetyl-CoA synthetase